MTNRALQETSPETNDAAAGVLDAAQAARQSFSSEFISNPSAPAARTGQANEAQGTDGFQISDGPPKIGGLLETPGDGEAQVRQAINNAHDSVWMWMYHLTDPGTTQALIDAKNRGLDVQVILDKGSLNTPSFAASYNALQKAGVDVTPSSDAFSISHAKTMIVDGDTSYITSINLTKIPGVTRDFGVPTDDPMITNDLKKLFQVDKQNAQNGGSETPAPLSPFLVESPINTQPDSQKLADNLTQFQNAISGLSQDQQAAALQDLDKSTKDFTPIDQLAAEKDLSQMPNGQQLVNLFAERMQDNQIDRIAALINRAQTSVVGETENLGAPEIQAALKAAVQRGVDVELIIPEDNRGANANGPAVQELLAAGAHVKEMPGPPTADQPYVHAKWLVRDGDQEAYLGSENYTRNSLYHARELGLIMYDKDAMHQMTSDFQHDWSVADSGPFDGSSNLSSNQ